MRKIIAFAIASFFVLSALGTLVFSYDGKDNIDFHGVGNVYEKGSGSKTFQNGELNYRQYNDNDVKKIIPDVKKLNILPKMFDMHIYTKCGDVEKNTSIIYGLLFPIDVDDNSNTGENGKDIKVRFLILPYLSQKNFGWVLSFSIVMDVERLGNEIKDEDFEIYAYFHLSLEDYGYGDHEFCIGYSSPEGKGLPRNDILLLTIYPYLMYDKNPDFILQNTPVFDGEESDMDVMARYSGNFGGNTFDHNVAISYQPAIPSTIKFTPDFSISKINTSISRTADKDTTLTLKYNGKTNDEEMGVALTIDKIPREMTFSILYNIFGPSGENGMIDYESSSEFNVTLTVGVSKIGLMGTMRLEYLPRHFAAEWSGRVYGGYINVSVNSQLTKFIICDDIDNPSVYFSISNITNSANFSWGMDQGGYIELRSGHEGPKTDFYRILGSMRVEMISEMKTDYLFLSWNIDREGYVTLDTNGNWLNEFSFNFTIDNNVGLLIGASFLKADNFRAEWVTWPPNFQLSGDKNFIGNIVFSVMLGGAWYPIL